MTAAALIELASGVAGPLIEAFKDEDFVPPNITFSETETTLSLVIQGAHVSGTHSLSTRFIADYWRGNLLFSEVYNRAGGDTLTVSLSLIHQIAEEKPHPTDIHKSKVLDTQLTIDSAIETKNTAEKSSQKDIQHAAGHSDSSTAKLTATVVQGTVVNDINNWSFRFEAAHNDRPAISFRLTPDYSEAFAGIVKVGLIASDQVHDITGLDVTLQHDGRLLLRPDDIEFGPLLEGAAVDVNLDKPAHATFHIQTDHPITGPGTLATLRFHTPQPDVKKAYVINAVDVRATDHRDRQLPVGFDDLTVNPSKAIGCCDTGST